MNGSELRQEAEELAEVIHAAHRSYCLGDRVCAESRIIAVALIDAGYERDMEGRRSRRIVALLIALAVGSVVAAAVGLAGVSYLLLSAVAFGITAVYLLGGDR